MRSLKILNVLEFKQSDCFSLHKKTSNACVKYMNHSFLTHTHFSTKDFSLKTRFNRWKSSLIANPKIMGGEVVFPDTRLTVRHVGGMVERGELPAIIREDYPYLTDEDIQFAHLYVKENCRVERFSKH